MHVCMVKGMWEDGEAVSHRSWRRLFPEGKDQVYLTLLLTTEHTVRKLCQLTPYTSELEAD